MKTAPFSRGSVWGETGTVERHVAEGDTREDENDGAGSYTRGQAPPSTTSELVVCERLD